MRGKKHIPNKKSRAKVILLKSCDVSDKVIAKMMDLSLNTLKACYKDELLYGREKANSAIASALFTKAQNGHVTAMIFWLKCRANWKETQVQEHVFEPQPIWFGELGEKGFEKLPEDDELVH